MASPTPDLDNKPEEDMTNDERMQWLRARGVVVEEPAGRNPVASAVKGSFTYVKIPMDDSKECEERLAPKGDGDALLAVVGPEFAGDGGVSDDALRKTAEQMGQSVGVAAMRQVLAKGGAETFRLAVPTDANQRESVYAYLDEASSLKGLPVNRRATELCARCGFPASCELRGDIFIGRQRFASVGKIESLDFFLPELEPASLWQRRAVTENLEFQKATQPEAHAQAQDSGDGHVFGPASGAGDGYTWRDEGENVEISVQVDEKTTKKDVKVDFKKTEVRVTKPLTLTLKLFRPVDPDGCTWTVGAGQVVLTLEKELAAPWPQATA